MSRSPGVWQWLADEPHHTSGLRVLQVCIGTMLCFRVATEYPFASYLWGPSGLGWGSVQAMFGAHVATMVNLLFASEFGVRLVMMTMAAGGLGLIFGYRTRIAVGLCLVPLLLLEQRLPELADGGDNIARLTLTYMLFALPAGARPVRGSLGVWLHNLAVAAIATQVMILYATSGLMKTYGEKWHNGTAMYYISQVEWFSLPAFRELFKNPFVTTAGSYIPLFFMMFFPIAMFSRLKLVWLAVGFVLHAGIATFMGLITFSTVMIGLELFLITDREYHWLLRMPTRALDALFPALPANVSAHGAQARQLVFIDGYCPHCRMTGEWLGRIAGARRVEIRSFRHDGSYRSYGIPPAQLERRMYVVDRREGQVWDGFSALCALARAVPAFWPAYPVFAVVRWLGKGDALYDALAARRLIIPDPRTCENGCALPSEELVTTSVEES